MHKHAPKLRKQNKRIQIDVGEREREREKLRLKPFLFKMCKIKIIIKNMNNKVKILKFIQCNFD